ncbi:MAG: hypothetical protein WB973_19580 [Thermoanaerobaculia bacterium]
MNFRKPLAFLLLVFVSLHGQAATKKKKPLALKVSPAASGLPLVTLTASDAPLTEVAARLAKELGVTVDVSVPARTFRVTAELDRQPLDLTLRQLAPQGYVDGILNGGPAGKTEIRTIYLRNAGEQPPSLKELEQRSSQTVMFYGNTEDPSVDPFAGQLEVTYRNDRFRVFARKQPLSVVVSKIADALGLPVELIGDSSTLIDGSVTDATLEQVMTALTPEAKLYYRLDVTTLRMTPVRFVVQADFQQAKSQP